MWGELASLREKEKRDERREAGEREKRMEKMRENRRSVPGMTLLIPFSLVP